ncbi:uncharacterized protein LOC144165722 isoform X3 [Haemaphysalis longicornis]
MTRLTFALASSLILPALVATAASPECSRLSLTNIIGLGTCLQNKGELCSPNTGGAVEFLKAFFECFSSGLKKLNVYDQTVILVAFSQYLVERVTAVPRQYGIGVRQRPSGYDVGTGKSFQVHKLRDRQPA